MKNLCVKILISMAAAMVLFSCNEHEDPGPLQGITREYPLIDFDKLEMGSGFNITVEEGNAFMIRVKGDRRNVTDLDVFKVGNTLRIEYDEQANRRHETYITIQMPTLRAVNFSGGSVSVISGFESDGALDMILSGGSVSQLNAGYREINVILNGASVLRMHGLGDEMKANVSGASTLSAFDYPVGTAVMDFSGASSGKVTVSDELKVTASGASNLIYRGNPSVEKNVSGGSSVLHD